MMTDAPYQRHSETSREAAERIEPRRATDKRRIMEYMKLMGEAIDEWMQRDLRLNPSTQRPRRIELVASGHLRDSGRTALTKSGRRATLWVLNDGEKQGRLF